jgi:hypothetical protein
MISKSATKEMGNSTEKKNCFIQKYLVHFPTLFS